MATLLIVAGVVVSVVRSPDEEPEQTTDWTAFLEQDYPDCGPTPNETGDRVTIRFDGVVERFTAVDLAKLVERGLEVRVLGYCT